jgi:hypothetical protein
VNGLATFLSANQYEIGGLSVFCGEGLNGHDLES